MVDDLDGDALVRRWWPAGWHVPDDWTHPEEQSIYKDKDIQLDGEIEGLDRVGGMFWSWTCQMRDMRAAI
jgi:hypothetical protein